MLDDGVTIYHAASCKVDALEVEMDIYTRALMVEQQHDAENQYDRISAYVSSKNKELSKHKITPKLCEMTACEGFRGPQSEVRCPSLAVVSLDVVSIRDIVRSGRYMCA